MKGHLPLIAMRRQGARPDVVFVETEGDSLKSWMRWPDVSPRFPHVLVEPDDSVARLDLRFVVDLTVFVAGEAKDRVHRVAQRCQQAGAARVIACVFAWTLEFGELVPTPSSFADTLTGDLPWPTC